MKKKLFCLLLVSLIGVSTCAEARLPAIKPGVPGQKPGDIIAPMLDEQVAAWCDFKKQIVVTRTNILCAYVGDKTTSISAQWNKASTKKLAKSKPIPKELTPTPYEMNEYGDT